VYLFAIIDVYSRKIVGWHLGLNARVDSMKRAWDKALANEELVGVMGVPQMPTALSDHGMQMGKKSSKQFFKDFGIRQFLLGTVHRQRMPGLRPGSVFSNGTG